LVELVEPGVEVGAEILQAVPIFNRIVCRLSLLLEQIMATVVSIIHHHKTWFLGFALGHLCLGLPDELSQWFFIPALIQ
jgi:hypothetical protein